MAGNPVNQWANGVLQGLGIRPSAGALQALKGWARAEGGHTNGARYNFLNTTQPEPGAGNTGTQGNIKVYNSLGQGVQATVQTLKNGRYDGIIAGLRAGNPNQVAQAIGQSPWGTSGSLVARTIAETSPGSPAPSAPSVTPAGPTTRTTTTPGVDNSLLRQQLVSQFLQQGGVKSSNASLAFASGMRNAQDVLATTSFAPTPHRQPVQVAPQPAATGGGVATFDGKRVAAWIAPALEYARQHGWKGTVSSGYRSYADPKRIYDSGVRPAAVPGTSNHEGAAFPRGAVDVTDEQQLNAILLNSPYRKRLVWAGSRDHVHFSHPHNGGY